MGCFMKHQFPMSVLAPRAGLSRMGNYLGCSASNSLGPPTLISLWMQQTPVLIPISHRSFVAERFGG
jgi:hypothetical protein